MYKAVQSLVRMGLHSSSVTPTAGSRSVTQPWDFDMEGNPFYVRPVDEERVLRVLLMRKFARKSGGNYCMPVAYYDLCGPSIYSYDSYAWTVAQAKRIDEVGLDAWLSSPSVELR